MECNRDEAKRAKEIAENKFSTKDVMGAKKFALKAQSLYPGLDGISQFLAILDVYVAADNKINGELDLYGILGVNPLADDDTVRKHYRKLALSLHPDKNKSIGAEGAFQFVAEAWTILSDKEKRSVYDRKTNARFYKQKVHLQNGGSRPPKPPTQNGFHNFTKSTAARTTRVVSTKAKGTTSFMKDDFKTTSKMETYPTETGAGSKKGAGSTKTDGVGLSSYKQMPPKTFWTVCKRCKLQYEFGRMYLNLNLLCPTCQGPFHATETCPPNTNGSSKGSSKNGSNSETNKTTGVDSGHDMSTQSNPLSELSSSGRVKRDREETHKKEETVRRKISKKEGELPSKTKQDDNGGFHENTKKKATMEIKKKFNEDVANTGIIKDQLIKKATMEIKKKLNEWSSETVKGSLVIDLADDDEPLVTDVPDPEFHDFDSDRSEKCFEEGQVWAGYDDHDGMPRLCAMIKKVISVDPFKIKVCWFNPKPDNNPGQVLKAFGEFRPGKHEIVTAPNYFSHKANFSKQTTGNIRVFPRKGDVCALFRKGQTSDLVKNNYEIVEVDGYSEETGTIVTPLIKVSGFKTVFHRHLDPKETRVILENEMFMFSHRIPSCLLTGQESARAPKGCRELDPAAVPPQFLDVKESADEILEKDGVFAEADKIVEVNSKC